MRKFIYAFCFLVLYVSAYSQNSEGYIITNNHDTVFGYINDKDPRRNSLVCEFRESHENDFISYKPFDINSYQILGDKYYISKKIYIDTLYEELFLEYLVKGELSLYYTSRNGESLFFVQTKDDSLTLLNNQTIYYVFDDAMNTYKPSIIHNTGQEKPNIMNSNIALTNDINIYKGTLNTYLADAPELKKRIDNAKLSQKYLTKLAVDYHELTCTDSNECCVYQKIIERNNKLGVILQFNVLNYSDFDNTPYTLNSFGLSGLFQLFSGNERIYFNPVIFYSKSYSILGVAYDQTSYEYSLKNLNISLNFDYHLLKRKKIEVYSGAGLEFNKHKVNYLQMEIGGYYRFFYSSTLLNGLETFEAGGNLFTGIGYYLTDKIYLEAETGYSISSFSDIVRKSFFTNFGLYFKI